MSIGQQLIERCHALIPIKVISGHSLLVGFFKPDSIVLDLGSNHGNFSANFKKCYGGQIFAVEANPELYLELKNKGMEVIHAAASGKPGSVQFNIGVKDIESSIFTLDENRSQETISVEGLNYTGILEKFNLSACDLLKVDIEGAEIEFLNSMTDEELKQITQITVEFHSFMGYYSSEVSERVIERIKRVGFYDFRVYRKGDEDVLLVNKKLGLGAWWNLMKMLFIVRPLVSSFWVSFQIVQDIVGRRVTLDRL